MSKTTRSYTEEVENIPIGHLGIFLLALVLHKFDGDHTVPEYGDPIPEFRGIIVCFEGTFQDADQKYPTYVWRPVHFNKYDAHIVAHYYHLWDSQCKGYRIDKDNRRSRINASMLRRNADSLLELLPLTAERHYEDYIYSLKHPW